MTQGLLLLLYIVFHASTKESQAVSTAEGKEFVISTPSMKYEYDDRKSYPLLLLTAISSFDCSVTIVARRHISAKVNVTKSLKPFNPYMFSYSALYFGPKESRGYRWTLSVLGTHPLVLAVNMATNGAIAESFIGVPVAGWGQAYIVTTLDQQPSVVVVTNEFENSIKFTLRSPDIKVKVAIGDYEYKNGESFNIHLLAYGSYAVSNCNQNTRKSSFTGSSLYGERPFGVVTGNCNGVSDLTICEQNDNNSTADNDIGRTVAEMLLPVETLGRHFILFNFMGRTTSGFFLVTSARDKIRLTLTQADNEPLVVHYFHNVGDCWKVPAFYGSLTSSGPVQVVYVQNSSCSLERDGETSILLLTPVELYYYYYLCKVPFYYENTIHYITLVVQSKYSNTIEYMYNGFDDPVKERAQDLESVILWSVAHAVWQVNEYVVRESASFVVYSVQTRFACYLHGRNVKSTYMQSAGFISSNINTQFCSKSATSKKKGDLFDNDCDGWVDERDMPGTGNNDSIVDILSYFPTQMKFNNFQSNAGNHTPLYLPSDDNITLTPSDMNKTSVSSSKDFDQWGEWHCSRNCSVREMVRTRICLRLSKGEGCSGHALEVKHGDCYADFCPHNCSSKTFGDGCNYTCEHCLGDCNPFDGQCDQCSPGYDFPESGCQKDRQHYKEWTGWHCTEDCDNTHLVRERLCKTQVPEKVTELCTEEVKERKPGDCYVSSNCPTDCNAFTWGEVCNTSCEQCTEPCNKFTGECGACRPGYKGSKVGCTIPCGTFEYGPNCQGNCRLKCGDDCRERMEGLCEERGTSYTPVYVVAVLLVPCVTLAWFVYIRKNAEEMEYRKSLNALKTERSKSQQSLSSRKGSSISGDMSATNIRVDGSRVDPKEKKHKKKDENSVNADPAEVPKIIVTDSEGQKSKDADNDQAQTITVADEAFKTKNVDEKEPTTTN